jgi:hypothetical protein
MVGEIAKFHAAYDAWVAATNAWTVMWRDMAEGKRAPDQALLLELTAEMTRLHTEFVEASAAFWGFPKH